MSHFLRRRYNLLKKFDQRELHLNYRLNSHRLIWIDNASFLIVFEVMYSIASKFRSGDSVVENSFFQPSDAERLMIGRFGCNDLCLSNSATLATNTPCSLSSSINGRLGKRLRSAVSTAFALDSDEQRVARSQFRMPRAALPERDPK